MERSGFIEHIFYACFFVVSGFVFLLTIVSVSGTVVEVYAGQTEQEVALANNLERWNLPVFNMGAGLTYAADARGLQGGITNPASLARISSNQFSIEYQTWNEGWDLFSGGIARPLGAGSVFAIQVSWLDYGELTPDYDTQLYRPQGNELKGGFTYTQAFHDRFSIGATVNAMSSKIGFRDRETEFSADLGLLFRPGESFWLGAVGKNLNGSLEIDDKENKLPPEYRLGAAYYVFQERLGITVDATYREAIEDTGDEQIGMAGGIRLRLSPHFRFAAGYHSFDDQYDGYTGSVELMFPLFQWQVAVVDNGEESITRAGGTMKF
ncbi:MAG: hypothetical protein ACLFN5_04835 [bacterium]